MNKINYILMGAGIFGVSILMIYGFVVEFIYGYNMF